MFELGRISVTAGAQHVLRDSGQSADEFIQRHASGDWGDVSEETRRANQENLEVGGRLESVYHTAHAEKLLVVTEPDRSLTSVMVPEEF